MSAQADAANEAAAPSASAVAREDEGTAGQPSSPAPVSVPAVAGSLKTTFFKKNPASIRRTFDEHS